MRRNSAVHASELTVMQRLRAAGLRPTMARIGLMQVVESAEAIPLPAHEVYRQLYLRGTPVSLGTVVRQLRELAQAGLLKHNGKKATSPAIPNAAELISAHTQGKRIRKQRMQEGPLHVTAAHQRGAAVAHDGCVRVLVDAPRCGCGRPAHLRTR